MLGNIPAVLSLPLDVYSKARSSPKAAGLIVRSSSDDRGGAIVEPESAVIMNSPRQ